MNDRNRQQLNPSVRNVSVYKQVRLIIAAGAITLLLFSGRWGLNFESQAQSLSTLLNIFYEFAFQLRWWILVGLALFTAWDYSQTRKRRAFLTVKTSGFIATLLLLFVMLGGAAVTDGREETIAKAFDIVGLAIGVALIFYHKNASHETPDELERLTLLMCLGLGLLMSVVAFATSDLSQRAAVGDGGPNTFVRIVGVTAISCVAIKTIPRWLAFIAVACFLTLVVLTQSRGGLLAFLCAAGLQFIWIFGWRSKLVYGLIGLAAGSAIAIFTPTGRHCVEIVEERVFAQTMVYSYTAGRDIIYAESLQIWSEEFAFGHGLNQWWPRLETYPHNIFLEIGCDSGALGIGIFLALIIITTLNAYKSKTVVSKSIACLVLFYFLAAQFSGDIYDSRGFFYFSTLVCASGLDVTSRKSLHHKNIVLNQRSNSNRNKRELTNPVGRDV